MFKNMSLTAKLVVFFLLVGIVPIGVMSLLALNNASTSLSAVAYGQLESMRDVKKEWIGNYFAERMGDIKVLGANEMVLLAIEDYETA